MGLHADQSYAAPPWLATPLAVNVAWVVLPWIRPQVNWNRALDPAVVAAADDVFLQRLGYLGGNQEELAVAFRRRGEEVAS